MAIFGRSKKHDATDALAYPAPSPVYRTQVSQRQFEKASQSTWTLAPQRPTTPHQQPSPPQQGWPASPPQSSPVYQPVYVSPSYAIPSPPPLPQRTEQAFKEKKSLRKLKSIGNLLSADLPSCVPGAQVFNGYLDAPTYLPGGTQYLNQGAALYDLISSKFDAVVTLIDGERFSGDERELVVYTPPQPIWQQPKPSEQGIMVDGKSRGVANTAISSALTSTNYFAKVNLYANSRLPPNLPPLKLYMPTYTLLCLASQYSERVYSKPSGKERDTHVEADWRQGTKAMVIKSVPVDDRDTIVFAIRGTQTFLDWAVNLNSAPASPEGFLDDSGNLCHAGFLTVAKKMIKPVAARLRHMLEEDPSRAKCSLLITGHSAGGAVASLLYSHMLSTSIEAESELTALAGCFKRIHCISFGAPPVSLLPLRKPERYELKKSVFLSFVNEGDPVARADKAYVRSLLDLYSTPAPGHSCMESITPHKLQPLVSNIGKSTSTLTVNKLRPSHKKSQSAPASTELPIWPVPEAALSNAGRIVLLRSVERYVSLPNKKKHVQELMDQGVVAQIVTDDLLRGVVWGDPVCHMMRLYARRIEILATNAVMGRG
ncbi:hypothetical protein BP6252_12746 [Coleophoma cylindrospora]|uniref:Fungal lipase-type domain-containing protein n=1 Tax=Coleophoma cylindrospora TaxID=1849047 RepID=A0A3D8QCY9_9HELO|nr:hypothetical protein BP6252_12746 [Coleophoma cylindrospora]